MIVTFCELQSNENSPFLFLGIPVYIVTIVHVFHFQSLHSHNNSRFPLSVLQSLVLSGGSSCWSYIKVNFAMTELATSHYVSFPMVKDEHFQFTDYNQRIIIAIMLCTISLVGSVGNSLVILAVVLSRKLRTPTNLFVVNLASADLMTCLSLPFQVIAVLSRSGWPLPEWICAVLGVVVLVCLGASMVTLALIAFSRWYLLTKPRLSFQRMYTIRNYCLMIGFSWMYPSLLTIVPHFTGLGVLGYSIKYKRCTQDNYYPTADYYSLIAGAGVIIPLSIAIAVIYIRIYLFVYRHNKNISSYAVPKIRITKDTRQGSENSSEEVNTKDLSVVTTESWRPSDTTEPTTTLPNVQGTGDRSVNECLRPDSIEARVSEETTVGNTPVTVKGISVHISVSSPEASTTPNDQSFSSHEESIKTHPQLFRHHVNVTKRLALIVVAFFICYLPYGMSSVFFQSEVLTVWTFWMMVLNCCINPIIYARTMPAFRKVMRCIIQCRFKDIPEPISFIRRTQ